MIFSLFTCVKLSTACVATPHLYCPCIALVRPVSRAVALETHVGRSTNFPLKRFAGPFRELDLCIRAPTDVINPVFLHVFFGHLILFKTRNVLADLDDPLRTVFPCPCGSRTGKMALEALI
jgi:hypothetical protein